MNRSKLTKDYIDSADAIVISPDGVILTTTY